MKLLISKDWLRRKITADPDIDIEAGRPLSDGPEHDAVMGEQKIVQLRMALGVLIRQLRLREQLSIAELAQRAQVAEDDLRRVEHDPHYTARPRLIFQLSQYFNVPLTELSQMAGATHAVNRSLYNEAVRYAARSDDVSALSDEERRDLDAFVAMLNNRGKRELS
jgi:transcriptional regulator with XRE-family HTH domain